MLEPDDGVSVYAHWEPDEPARVIAARSLAAAIEDVHCIWTGEPDSLLGRHVRLVGPEDLILMTFPWWDHADRALAMLPDGWAPLAVPPGELYDDLEQGWFQSTIELDGWVYVFEANFDELCGLHRPVVATGAEELGHLAVGSIDATWFKVPADTFRGAWRDAQAEARRLNGPR